MDNRRTMEHTERGGASGPRREVHQPTRRRRGWRRGALLLAVGLVLGLAPAGLAHAASGDCATSGGEVTCTYSYSYTGGEQTFTVPAGVTVLSVTAVGGRGADGYNGYNPAGVGGAGGVVTAAIPVTPAEALYVEVGGNGAGRDGFYRGGFNGGGNAGSGAGAGGGASDVRTCSSSATSCATADDSLDSRLLVAAGGGGAGGFTYGGSGGPAGQPGSTGGALYCGFTPGSGGAAGTPTGGGSGGAAGSASPGYNAYPGQDGALGVGGSASPNSVVGGGGGGGGYYGGGAGGGAVSCAGGGGGGGSNLVPVGGTSGLDTTGTPEVVITYALPVASTSTTLTSAPNPSIYGQSVTLTATVAGAPGITPTGTITFTDGTTTLGTAPLDGNGTATFSTGSLSAGSHAITAVYGGGATDAGSASAVLSQQVNPAPLTITASSPSVVYGGVPAITLAYSGFVAGDTAASLSTAPTCASTAPSSGAAGAYLTSCSGAVDPNYTISYQPGTLTINQASQAISFTSTPPDPARVGATYTATATGGASGNPVTFTAGPSSICTAGGSNGATITLLGVGTCTVTADQAGNGNYQAAQSVAQSFTVSYPPLSLALGVSSSPAGPVTTGSTVTASLTLGNHTTASQTVTLKVTLAYTGSRGSYSLTVPLKVTLSAGQTVGKGASFTIAKWFPRGSYTLSVTATDGSGDTASGSAALTVG